MDALPRFLPALVVVAAAACGLAGCAGNDGLQKDLAAMKEELAAQRRVQTELRDRLERLDNRLSMAESNRAAASAPKPVGPVVIEIPKRSAVPDLPVVRLSPNNPAARAPKLDTRVTIIEPTEEQMDAIVSEADLATAAAPVATDALDIEFASALRSYNAGGADRTAAGLVLDMFATEHPKHAAADNALYLSGMALVAAGKCTDARAKLDAVVSRYPDGDAAPGALLALGQCEKSKARPDQAKAYFERVVKDHAATAEATTAAAELEELKRTAVAGRTEAERNKARP